MSDASTGTAKRIEYDQWLWWCRDNKAVQDRNLGLANCLVCAEEPREIVAWGCGPEHSCPAEHAQANLSHHVLFKGCGHQIEVAFSWEAPDRVYG